MTAPVIDLASRRRNQPMCGCPRHELDALLGRARQRLDEHDALLIPRSALEAVLDDLRATTDRLLPPTGDRPEETQTR